MPVPKRKTSKRRRDQRHANNHLEVQTFNYCPNSGAPVMPHTVCLESGYYKGVKVMTTKQDRLEARGKKRAAAEKAAPMEAEEAGNAAEAVQAKKSKKKANA